MQEQKNELRGDSRTVSLDSGTLSRKVSNYERLFLLPVKTAALHGKAIYVRPEFHQRILRLVRLVDDDKISMYSYLDRVLDTPLRNLWRRDHGLVPQPVPGSFPGS